MKVIRRLGLPHSGSRLFASSVIAALGMYFGLVELAAAEPPQPLLSCVYPAGGQRGTTFEATVFGTNLQAASTVHISGRDVIGMILPGGKPDSTRIAVTIARDAVLGERDLRLLTPGGVSNRYRFIIGDLPEITESEPNTEPGQAQRLDTLPVLVNGQITEPDRDFFRFKGRAGQTLVFALQGRTLLPYIPDAVPGWLDGCLTIYDPAGTELATIDDYRLNPDPVLFFPVPRDGEYVLEVRDILYRGRNTFVYRLKVGAIPFLTYLSPLGGQHKTETLVQLHGVNLPLSTLKVTDVDSGGSIREIGMGHVRPGSGPSSNALPFALGPHPETRETEPNDLLASANKIVVPVAVNGRIDRDGDNDYFRFTVQAGQVLAIETQARRLGSPVDTMLYLLNAAGQELARNDETVDPDPALALLTHHADSRLIYNFPTAGDYVVRIKNLQPGGGDEYAYRLLIGPPRPDFYLRLTPDNPRMTRGDTTALTIKAIRIDGFGGEIALRVANLPQGYSASSAFIPAGQDTARLTVTAPMKTSTALVLPTVLGTAKVANAEVSHAALGSEDVMQAFSYHHDVPTQEVTIAILEPHALTLGTSNPPGKISEVRQGTEIPVLVHADRHEGTKGPINLTADAPPPGISLKTSPTVIPADKTDAVVTLVISNQTAVGGLQTVILTGTMNTETETVKRLAPALSLKVAAAVKVK